MKKFLLFLAVFLPSFAFVSCGEEDEEIFEDVYMFAGTTQKFDNNLKWTSSNALIANIKDNEIHALYVGEATMTSGKYSFKVIVVPYYGGIYKEPCLDWGCDMAHVKEFMTGYKIIGTPTASELSFDGKNKETGYVYMFDDGKLQGAGVVVEMDNVDIELLSGFIKERYVYVGQQLGTYTYFTVDKNTVVSLKVTSTRYVIMYIDAHSGASANKFNFQDSLFE